MRKAVLAALGMALALITAPLTVYAAGSQQMHCLYNAANKEFLYTIDENEKNALVGAWQYRGVVCTLPSKSNTPVYRLCDPKTAQHLYTSDEAEINKLVGEGWNKEGIAYYVDDAHTAPIYRLFNAKTGEHQFSGSEKSISVLETQGWVKEGIAYYALEAYETSTEPTNTKGNTAGNTANSAVDFGKPGELVHNYQGTGYGPGYRIRDDFDYTNMYNGMAWSGDYWIASNGVVIKVITVDGNIYERLPVPDGKGKDNEPGSPFRVACNEAAGTGGVNYQTMSETIPVTSYKRASIDTTDAGLVAFKKAYDSHYGGYTSSGIVNGSLALFYDGVADVDTMGANWWSISRIDDYWKLKINGNLDAWRWSGVHQFLRYLSPDGEALYAAIYDDFYVASEDNPIQDWDSWWSVGSSLVYSDSTANGVVYYFK